MNIKHSARKGKPGDSVKDYCEIWFWSQELILQALVSDVWDIISHTVVS